VKVAVFNPNCPNGKDCPAIYVDDQNGRIVLQGMKLDQDQRQGIGLPDHEEAVAFEPEVLERLLFQWRG
jgi:hypothetical protein